MPADSPGAEHAAPGVPEPRGDPPGAPPAAACPAFGAGAFHAAPRPPGRGASPHLGAAQGREEACRRRVPCLKARRGLFLRGASEPGVSLLAHRRRYSRASLRDYPHKPRAGGLFHPKFARLGKCRPFRRSVARVGGRRAFPEQPLRCSGRHQAVLHGMPPSPRRAGGPGAGAHVVPQPPRHAPAVGRPYLTWAGGCRPFQEACAYGSQGSGNGRGCPFAHSRPSSPLPPSRRQGSGRPAFGGPPGCGKRRARRRGAVIACRPGAPAHAFHSPRGRNNTRSDRMPPWRSRPRRWARACAQARGPSLCAGATPAPG